MNQNNMRFILMYGNHKEIRKKLLLMHNLEVARLIVYMDPLREAANKKLFS